jgi:hypothetical protein
MSRSDGAWNSAGSISILEKISSAIMFPWFLIIAREWVLTSRASFTQEKIKLSKGVT